MVLTVLSGAAALAQNYQIFNNPFNMPYWGIRVGGDITCPGKISEDFVGVKLFRNGGGAEFGGIYNYPVVANFYLEPGLKLYYDTYSMNDDILGALHSKSAVFKKIGVRVPVMAGYHFDFTDNIKVSVFTGPELEFGISAKEYIDGEMSGNLYGDYGDMNRVNLLWCVGAGVAYKNFYFGLNGGIGMLNMLKDSDAKFHENRVTFSIGYNFDY